MPSTHSVAFEGSSTTAEHWVRPFSIIDRPTGDDVERGGTRWRHIRLRRLSATAGAKILAYTTGISSQGTPCLICGYQWAVEPEYELVLRGATGEANAVEFEESSPEFETASVETPREALGWIKEATGLADGDIGGLLGVSRPTLEAWRQGENISTRHLRRLYAVRDILQRAAGRLPSREHLRGWLVTPRGADSRTPEELLRSGELDRARLLAISMPSPRIARPPAWVRQETQAAWRIGAEGRQEPELPEDEQDIPAVPRRKADRRIVLKRRGDERI